MKYILITGASQGIGEEFSSRFAERKENLILVARSEERLKSIAERLRKLHGVDIITISLDLSVPDSTEKLASRVLQLSISGLINNAGVGIGDEFMNQKLSQIESMLNLNILSLTKLTHLMLPKLIEAKGFVINVASTAAFQPIPYMTAYAATKSYVLNFSEALNFELKKKGVYVLALCPGATETGFFDAAKISTRDVQLPMQKTTDVVSAAMNAFDSRKAIVVSGWKNKMAAFSGRLAPRSLVVKISAKLMGH